MSKEIENFINKWCEDETWQSMMMEELNKILQTEYKKGYQSGCVDMVVLTREQCAKIVEKYRFENAPKPFKKEMENEKTIGILFDYYLDLITKAIRNDVLSSKQSKFKNKDDVIGI